MARQTKEKCTILKNDVTKMCWVDFDRKCVLITHKKRGNKFKCHLLTLLIRNQFDVNYIFSAEMIWAHFFCVKWFQFARECVASIFNWLNLWATDDRSNVCVVIILIFLFCLYSRVSPDFSLCTTFYLRNNVRWCSDARKRAHILCTKLQIYTRRT